MGMTTSLVFDFHKAWRKRSYTLSSSIFHICIAEGIEGIKCNLIPSIPSGSKEKQGISKTADPASPPTQRHKLASKYMCLPMIATQRFNFSQLWLPGTNGPAHPSSQLGVWVFLPNPFSKKATRQANSEVRKAYTHNSEKVGQHHFHSLVSWQLGCFQGVPCAS